MTIRAAVVGASGYAGGELLRLIHDHPHFDIGPLMAGTNRGNTIASVHPQLTGLGEVVFQATDPSGVADCDVVFVALPHGESAAFARHVPPQVRIVDLGADFRLDNAAAWETYYGGEHAGTWVYGLPEFGDSRRAISAATRIANPGCYPTSVVLGAAPVLAAGLMAPEQLVVVAASGTSGAGRASTPALMASQVMGSMSAYKVAGTHQHTPEMEQMLSAAAAEPVTVSFTPLLAPMSRGILATISAPSLSGATTETIRESLYAAYLHDTFVEVLPEGQWPQTSSTYGSNSVHIQAAVDSHAQRVVIVVALDNLVKGAAGQAIQNANLMLGLPETTGLPSMGIAP